eukprot:jgi/Tetstr1/434233/TSEL_023344.t1
MTTASRRLLALALLAACLPSTGALTKRYEVDDRFPGWKGEVADVRVGGEGARVAAATGGRHGSAPDWGFGALKESWRGEVDVVNWEPRVVSYKGFLSVAECEALLELGRDSDMPSTLALPDDAGVTVAAVNKRIGETTMFRRAGMADLTLHLDEAAAASPVASLEHAPTANDQRLATLYIKLSPHSSLGGEIVLPQAPLPSDWQPSGPRSPCAGHIMAYPLRQGDAVLVYHRRVNNEVEPAGTVSVCGVPGEEVMWATQTLMTWRV